MCWTDGLVDVYWLMHWPVCYVLDRHVGWRLLTDALTCWLVCWVDMFVAVKWYIDVLADVLSRHVGWRLLTDALACWLACWIDMFVDMYWLMHWRVGCVLSRHVGWRVLTDALTCWLCVELTYWLLFTDWCIDVLVVCWVDMLVDVNCFAQFICCGPVVAFDRYKKKKEK